MSRSRHMNNEHPDHDLKGSTNIIRGQDTLFLWAHGDKPATRLAQVSIKSRNIAAIGLLSVWYLLTPPFTPGDPPGPLQLNAPLSQWSQMDSCDSDSGCEEQLDNMVRMYRSGDMTSVVTQFKLWLYHNALCVASTDSRLRSSGKRSYHKR